MHACRSWLGLGLAACLAASGCATVHLAGEYRPNVGTDIVHRNDKRVVAEGSEWFFLWGIFDSGRFDLNEELHHTLHEDEALANVAIEDRISFGGVVLWIITAGIVSHHDIIVSGEPAQIHAAPAGPSTSAPPAGYPPGTVREKETIIVKPEGKADEEKKDEKKKAEGEH